MSLNKFTSAFRIIIPLASLILTACTITDDSQKTAISATAPQWKSHVAQIENLERYQTRGAFAYLSDSKKTYARFFWQQYSPTSYKLLLTNPVGSTELELIVTQNSVQLTDNKGQKYYSEDPQDMIYQLTGMSIPLENLRQWMKGLPGDAQSYAINNQYHLKQLTYSQGMEKWNVDYQSYNDKVSPAMPDKLEISQGSDRIKLKMDVWKLD